MKLTGRYVYFLLQIVAVGFAGVHGAALAATVTDKGADKRVFAITAATKDKTHPFFGQGHKIGLVLDGVQGKALVLTRGAEYTFNVDTGPQHDFYFSTSAVGQGGSTVTDGVEGQFTFRGTVTFTPSATTPDVVYYQCRNHRSMGGMLKVVDKGKATTLDEVPPVAPGAAAAEGHPAMEHPPVTEAQVKQKIEYANMLMNSSKGAQRVAASSNAQAKEMLANARTRLESARSVLGAGNVAKAQDEVDESIRLVTGAARLVPSDAPESGLDPKFRYTELLDSTKTFESSYKQHSERLADKKKPAAALDEKKFQDLMSQAKGHGDAGRYEDANKLLANAQRMVTRALGALLDHETVVYDKNFATPAAEYDYEVSRYKSYEELIPLALEQKKPPAMTVDKMAELEQKSKGLVAEAAQLAGKGDHAAAISALQEATSYLQRALMIAGVN